MLNLLAQKLSTVSRPLAVHARSSLAVWQYAPMLNCLSTIASAPTDRLALSPSRFATLEAKLSKKIAGTFQLRPPPNLNDLLQRTHAAPGAVKNIRFATQDQFVGREAEIARLLKVNHETNHAAFKHNLNLHEFSLCVVAQVLGAGATKLLRNYVPRLTNPTSAAAIAKAYEERFCTGKEQEVACAESKAVLAATAGMRATIVDCNKTVKATLLNLANELATTWQFSLADCTKKTSFKTFEIALERARALGPVFIGLDEVFNFGNWSDTFGFSKRVQKDYADQMVALARYVDISTTEELFACWNACDKYRELRSELLQTFRKTAVDDKTKLRRHEVHFVVAGRVPMIFLHLINEHLKGPPYTTAPVLLQPLSQDAMREVVLNPGYQLHGLTPESTDALVSELRSMSAGQPRYVHYALAEIGGVGLAVNTPEAARQAVHDAAWIIIRSGNHPIYINPKSFVRSNANVKVLRTLAFCDSLDFGLDVTAERDSNDLVKCEHIALLDASAYLPVMLEPHPTKTNHVIPRVAWPVVTKLFDKYLHATQFVDYLIKKTPCKLDVGCAMQRGFAAFWPMIKLDPQQTMPLSAMLPWLPEELANVALRVQAVQPQLINISVPTADMFAKLAAAGAATATTSDALEWFEDPANFHKVLLLLPRAQSPTADIFLFVPVAAQVPTPGETAKPLLFQIRFKDAQASSKNMTWADFQTDVNHSLHEGLPKDFHNVFVLLTVFGQKNIAPGIYKNTAGNFSAIVAKPEEFIPWVEPHDWVYFSAA